MSCCETIAMEPASTKAGAMSAVESDDTAAIMNRYRASSKSFYMVDGSGVGSKSKEAGQSEGSFIRSSDLPPRRWSSSIGDTWHGSPPVEKQKKQHSSVLKSSKSFHHVDVKDPAPTPDPAIQSISPGLNRNTSNTYEGSIAQVLRKQSAQSNEEDSEIKEINKSSNYGDLNTTGHSAKTCRLANTSLPLSVGAAERSSDNAPASLSIYPKSSSLSLNQAGNYKRSSSFHELSFAAAGKKDTCANTRIHGDKDPGYPNYTKNGNDKVENLACRLISFSQMNRSTNNRVDSKHSKERPSKQNSFRTNPPPPPPRRRSSLPTPPRMNTERHNTSVSFGSGTHGKGDNIIVRATSAPISSNPNISPDVTPTKISSEMNIKNGYHNSSSLGTATTDASSQSTPPYNISVNKSPTSHNNDQALTQDRARTTIERLQSHQMNNLSLNDLEHSLNDLSLQELEFLIGRLSDNIDNINAVKSAQQDGNSPINARIPGPVAQQDGNILNKGRSPRPVKITHLGDNDHDGQVNKVMSRSAEFTLTSSFESRMHHKGIGTMADNNDIPSSSSSAKLSSPKSFKSTKSVRAPPPPRRRRSKSKERQSPQKHPISSKRCSPSSQYQKTNNCVSFSSSSRPPSTDKAGQNCVPFPVSNDYDKQGSIPHAVSLVLTPAGDFMPPSHQPRPASQKSRKSRSQSSAGRSLGSGSLSTSSLQRRHSSDKLRNSGSSKKTNKSMFEKGLERLRSSSRSRSKMMSRSEASHVSLSTKDEGQSLLLASCPDFLLDEDQHQHSTGKSKSLLSRSSSSQRARSVSPSKGRLRNTSPPMASLRKQSQSFHGESSPKRGSRSQKKERHASKSPSRKRTQPKERRSLKEDIGLNHKQVASPGNNDSNNKKNLHHAVAGNKKNGGVGLDTSSQTKFRFNKETGRCKKHPSIIVAKKSNFGKGSWIILNDGCALCNAARKDKASHHDHYEHPTVTDAGSTPVTGSTPRVQRMEYNTPWGESGWYTGEVNASCEPHGYGRMRCKTGNTIEGDWVNGYSEEFLEKKKRMKSGFGTNIAPWQEKGDPRNRRDGPANPSPPTTYSSPDSQQAVVQPCPDQFPVTPFSAQTTEWYTPSYPSGPSVGWYSPQPNQTQRAAVAVPSVGWYMPQSSQQQQANNGATLCVEITHSAGDRSAISDLTGFSATERGDN